MGGRQNRHVSRRSARARAGDAITAAKKRASFTDESTKSRDVGPDLVRKTKLIHRSRYRRTEGQDQERGRHRSSRQLARGTIRLKKETDMSDREEHHRFATRHDR